MTGFGAPRKRAVAWGRQRRAVWLRPIPHPLAKNAKGWATGFLSSTVDTGALAAVVGGGFGVDEDAGYLGVVEAEFAFEVGDDFVHAGHRELVGEGAVAVDLDAGGGAAVTADYADLVDVDDLGEFGGGFAELAGEVLGGFVLGGVRDGGGLAFDVSEHGGDLGDLVAHL